MRAYQTSDGWVWPSREHAARYLLGNVAEVPADWIEPDGAIREVECASYDASPEVAFMDAWKRERESVDVVDQLKNCAEAVGATALGEPVP